MEQHDHRKSVQSSNAEQGDPPNTSDIDIGDVNPGTHIADTQKWFPSVPSQGGLPGEVVPVYPLFPWHQSPR